MEAANEIMKCLEERKMTQKQLAKFLGEDARNINQQLRRNKDMKVKRFEEVLNCIGYKIQIVKNDGIQKVSESFALKIIEDRTTIGRFWYQEGNKVIGIDNSEGEAFTEEFNSKEECFKWLIER